jgi:hypothetical protein
MVINTDTKEWRMTSAVPRIGFARIALALALVATAPACGAEPGSPAPSRLGSSAPTLGALFYINFAEVPAPGAPVVLHKVQDDMLSTALTVDAPSSIEHPGFTITVSPDGKRAAWVEGDILVVADLTIGERTNVRDGVTTMCAEPAWTADSTRLLIGLAETDPKTGKPFPATDRMAILTLSNGSVSVVAGLIGSCHPLWAADGQHIVYVGSTPGGLSVLRIGDAIPVQPVPNLGTIDLKTGSPKHGAFDYAWDLQSVSPDGSRAAVTLNDPRGGNPSRVLSSNAIVDTVRGVVVPAPLAGRMLNAFFLPDGGMLVRLAGEEHNELVLVSPDGKELARHAERTEVRQLALLAYAPA